MGGSPVNLLHIFRTPFTKNTSEQLLLVLFAFTNLSQDNFLYCNISYWNETAPAALTFFLLFCQVIEHQARQVQLFNQLFQISFLNCDKQKRLFLSRKIINELFQSTANVQLHKFRLKEGLKLVQHHPTRLISFIYSRFREALL